MEPESEQKNDDDDDKKKSKGAIYGATVFRIIANRFAKRKKATGIRENQNMIYGTDKGRLRNGNAKAGDKEFESSTSLGSDLQLARPHFPSCSSESVTRFIHFPDDCERAGDRDGTSAIFATTVTSRREQVN